MRDCLLALVVTLAICGCRCSLPAPTQLSDEDTIREAVFRYQFEFNASGQGKAANAYFLCVEGNSDPSSQLLAQFDGHQPPVKPVSASVLEAGTALVLDSESGLPGLRFWVEEIRYLSGSQAEVEGGYEEASESAAGSVYRLEKANGHWQVIASQMLWIK